MAPGNAALVQQVNVCVLHAEVVRTAVGGDQDVDLVVLDRAAGVLSDEHAVALDIDAAAQRDDRGVDRDRAALGRGGAGSRLSARDAVAGRAGAVEGQLVVAERGGVALDRVGRQQGGRIRNRLRSDRVGQQLVVSVLCGSLLGSLGFCFGLGFRLSLCLGLGFLPSPWRAPVPRW